jgi:sec-independent protein translocase protein TatA
MFSIPDIAIIGALALLLFGPDRLPGMMRQAGRFMREVQNTSQSFVAEMERAADTQEYAKSPHVYEPPEPREDEPPTPPEPSLRPPTPAP